MSLYLTLSHIDVQSANCVAGITYGFPGVTNFLGFSHALSWKLTDINLEGCAIICHQHQPLTYRNDLTNKSGATYLSDYYFRQTKNPSAGRYQGSYIGKTPPIVEEGKMHFTVSLVMECIGFSGTEDKKTQLLEMIKNLAMGCRLAGGQIINIKSAHLDSSEDDGVRRIRRRLLPGFVLMDQSHYLAEHLSSNPDIEILGAWLDFSAMKHKARPKSNLIIKHLEKRVKSSKEEGAKKLLEIWLKHTEISYEEGSAPKALINYFNSLENETSNSPLLEQWKNYIQPNEDSLADWERVPKPFKGYLVPIMKGFQPISDLYNTPDNPVKVKSARDPECPFCFVEAVYGIGEWKSPHRISSISEIIWHYDNDNLYLCKQNKAVCNNNDSESNDIDLFILGED